MSCGNVTYETYEHVDIGEMPKRAAMLEEFLESHGQKHDAEWGRALAKQVATDSLACCGEIVKLREQLKKETQRADDADRREAKRVEKEQAKCQELAMTLWDRTIVLTQHAIREAVHEHELVGGLLDAVSVDKLDALCAKIDDEIGIYPGGHGGGGGWSAQWYKKTQLNMKKYHSHEWVLMRVNTTNAHLEPGAKTAPHQPHSQERMAYWEQIRDRPFFYDQSTGHSQWQEPQQHGKEWTPEMQAGGQAGDGGAWQRYWACPLAKDVEDDTYFYWKLLNNKI